MTLAALLLAGCDRPRGDPLAAFQAGDYQRARELWSVQAESGDADAQNFLASLYYLGLGTDRDFQHAAYWYERAARQGQMDAQRNLGTMYQMGQAVAQDNLRAYIWYYAAAQNGSETAAAYLKTLDSQVTPNARMLGRALLETYLRDPSGSTDDQAGM
jgi:TPR repeat protein